MTERPDAEVLLAWVPEPDVRNRRCPLLSSNSWSQRASPSPRWVTKRSVAAARRRLGNVLYQSLHQNIETLNGYGVTKIVTPCPHCLQTQAESIGS
jgi:hypothetical protein